MAGKRIPSIDYQVDGKTLVVSERAIAAILRNRENHKSLSFSKAQGIFVDEVLRLNPGSVSADRKKLIEEFFSKETEELEKLKPEAPEGRRSHSMVFGKGEQKGSRGK